MKNLVTALLISASLVACGGKAKKPTTPDNSQTETKAGSTGGATYGGAAKGTAPAGNGSGSAGGMGAGDPCGSP